MTQAHYCDRCEALFAGPAKVGFQAGNWTGELCDSCFEEFRDWWEDTEDEKQTIGDQLDEQ